jgi:cellulose synthase/poly-beta-1,6-N-acetylglucosamine synthase-like glycosyltransferase
MEKKDFSHDTLIMHEGKNIKHIVIIPIYTEPYDVIEENILSILKNDYPFMENITVLLATEERAPEAKNNAEKIIANYSKKGINIVNIIHPD